MKLLKYFLIIAIVTGFVSCKKDEIKPFDEGVSGISLASGSSGSTNYSFVFEPATVTEDTVTIPVRIMGIAKDYDREVVYAIINDSTNVTSPGDYKILPVIVKKGEYTAAVQVIMYRTESVKNANFKKLGILLGVSPEFEQVNKAANQWVVHWSDGVFIRPVGWTDTYFGVFSQNKFKYMIEVTGLITFEGFTTARRQWVQAACKNAYNEYKASPGYVPIMDEITEREIVFP